MIESSNTRNIPDTPHIVAPPPLIFGGALVLGLALQRVRPVRFVAHRRGRLSERRARRAARAIGGGLVLGGLTLSGAVMRSFATEGTPVIPWQETRRLVVSGPYRFSRNPDYLGQASITAGAALIFGAPWALAALAPALLIVRYGVIAREERYLERRFGEEYRAFCRHVRRWM